MAEGAPSLRPDVLLAQAGWVRGLARALVLDSSRVDDVVQKTWLAALEQPEARVGNVRGWLAGIVRNVVREERRSAARRRVRERETRAPEPLPPVDELLERAELQKRLVQAVLELEEPLRSTCLWRYFEDLTAEEIARRQGLPASTVRSRLQAALESLRQRFDRERDGDRRAWSLALVPLLLPRESAGAALLVSTPSTGVLAMTLKGLFVTALVIGAGYAVTSARKLVRSAPFEPASALAAPSPVGAAPAVAGTAQESQRSSVAPGPSLASGVKGRVLDVEGAPVPGARVFVGGQPSPFTPVEAGLHLRIGDAETWRAVTGESGEGYREVEVDAKGLLEWAALDLERLKKHGTVLGKTVVTDDAGRFELPVPAKARVYVTVHPELGLRKVRNGAWHTTPAEGIELGVQRIPVADLSIWLTDSSTGQRVAFAGHLFDGERSLAEWQAESEGVRRTVEVEPGIPHHFRVEVSAPLWARTSRELQLTPGAETRLELLAQSGTGLSGLVVDARGEPLEGAFVYWGDELDLRDSLFHPYRPERVVGGVRTDATGRFTLPGTADARVSAWHPEHSPVSVAAGDAAHMVLPARGTLRGLVLDEHGLPAAGKEVTLDRARKAVTDARGAYVFERVESGVHGVGYWPDRFVGVLVAPGETLEVPPEDPVQPRVELLTGGAPFTAHVGGVIFGLGRVFSVSEWGNADGRLELGSVRAGRSFLMSNAGVLTLLDVQPERTARIELGTARVTLSADSGDPLVYLLPEEASAHPAAHFWARRFFAQREGGRIVYAPLAAGRYALFTGGRVAPLALEVAEGQELVIPREQWLGNGSER